MLEPVSATPPASSVSSGERPSTSLSARGLKRFRARWLALLAAMIIALYLCWLMLEPFVEVLLWAVVLVIVFFPVHRRILRRVTKPSAAAAMSCILIITVILVPLALITVAVASEATELARDMQRSPGRLLDPNNRVLVYLSRWVDVDQLVNRRNLADAIREWSGAIAGRTFIIAGSVAVIALKVIFVVLTMYYLFRDGERIQTAVLESMPLERPQSQRIFDRTREVIAASVYGVLMIASVQALLAGPMFWAVGLPSAVLWTVVLFFLSMVPMAGSFVVWVPASFWLLAQGHWIRALILTIWCLGVVSMADNVLRPRLVGRRTRMHELLVFFSVLGGLQLFGPLGLVVGPVVVAITLALLDIFRKADRPESAREPTLAEQQAALRDVPTEEGAHDSVGRFAEDSAPAT